MLSAFFSFVSRGKQYHRVHNISLLCNCPYSFFTSLILVPIFVWFSNSVSIYLFFPINDLQWSLMLNSNFFYVKSKFVQHSYLWLMWLGRFCIFSPIVHFTTRVGTTGYVAQIVMVKSTCLLFLFWSILLIHYRNQSPMLLSKDWVIGLCFSTRESKRSDENYDICTLTCR